MAHHGRSRIQRPRHGIQQPTCPVFLSRLSATNSAIRPYRQGSLVMAMPNASIRLGSKVQIASRRESSAKAHSAISSFVRPQPRHQPKTSSIVHIPVQGLGRDFGSRFMCYAGIASRQNCPGDCARGKANAIAAGAAEVHAPRTDVTTEIAALDFGRVFLVTLFIRPMKKPILR
jgi:hypothetical protein